MLSTSYVAYGSRHENGLKIRLMSGNGPGVEPGRAGPSRGPGFPFHPRVAVRVRSTERGVLGNWNEDWYCMSVMTRQQVDIWPLAWPTLWPTARRRPTTLTCRPHLHWQFKSARYLSDRRNISAAPPCARSNGALYVLKHGMQATV